MNPSDVPAAAPQPDVQPAAKPAAAILYLAADLLWASKIKGTADALEIPTRPVRTLEMLRARLAEGAPRAVLLDLDKPEEALAMIRELRSRPGPGPRIVAWGPHVAKDLLQAARDAGAHDVLTRGALEHNLPELLVTLAGRA